jgi:hypothetical protein
MLSHHARPQNVVAMMRPVIVTGATGWPLLRSFAIMRSALRRRSATGT